MGLGYSTDRIIDRQDDQPTAKISTNIVVISAVCYQIVRVVQVRLVCVH